MEVMRLLTPGEALELKKARRTSRWVPIGTQSRGRVKVAEGKWVPVKTGRTRYGIGSPPPKKGATVRGSIRKGPKINQIERKMLSQALYGAITATWYPEIPIKPIDDALRSVGFLLLDEDNTPWKGMLLGNNSNTLFTIGRLATPEHHDWGTTYTPIENSGVALSWYYDYRGGNPGYEIVTYLS